MQHMLYQEHSLDRPETVREVTLSPVLQAWTSLLHYIQIIALFLFFKSNRVNLMENYLLKNLLINCSIETVSLNVGLKEQSF